MADSVPSMPSNHKTGVVTHGQELTPGPQGEVLTIAFLAFLEVLRGLPIFLFAKQFFVRNGLAGREKFTDLPNRRAMKCERMAEVPPDRQSWPYTLPPQIWAEHFAAYRVINFGDSLCDQIALCTMGETETKAASFSLTAD